MMVMVCMSILCTIDCMHLRPVTGALIRARWRFQWTTRNLLTYPRHVMDRPRRGRIYGIAIGATAKKRLKVASAWGPIIGNVPFAGSKKLEHRSRVLSNRGGWDQRRWRCQLSCNLFVNKKQVVCRNFSGNMHFVGIRLAFWCTSKLRFHPITILLKPAWRLALRVFSCPNHRGLTQPSCAAAAPRIVLLKFCANLMQAIDFIEISQISPVNNILKFI